MSATAMYAVGNVVTSVALVLLNKKVFSGGFVYPMTLTFFHFVFTVMWYQMLALCNAFQKPAVDLPQMEKFKVAAAGFASIGFMNLSLNFNSVGFYQITKLTIVPVTLIINSVWYKVYTTTKIKVALMILLAGVGVATVTDLELRPVGMSFGVAAIISTAVFQIWQGTKQKEFGVSATQLQSGIAVWQSAQAFTVALTMEALCFTEPCVGPPTAIDFFKAAVDSPEKQHTMVLVLGTCFLALAVNLCSFGLIGRTSPITFQVVSHAKTCLVLIGGYMLFPAKTTDMQQVYNNIAGVSIAMIGVVLYGHINTASGNKQPDCFDYTCPGFVLSCLGPPYGSTSPSEREGLKSGSTTG